MARSLTYEEWIEEENGLSQFRFKQMTPETQDTLLQRYLNYRREQDDQGNSNRANK